MTTQNSLLGRRLKVTVSGKDYLVDVSGSPGTSPLTVHVNGQPYVVQVESAESATGPSQAPATPSSAAVAERPASVRTPPPAAATPTAPHVKAPMPGNIIGIEVQPGDQVKRGQALLTLEAMKMKNAIRSPRDGIVATVEVSEGQTVAHGQVLVTFTTDAP